MNRMELERFCISYGMNPDVAKCSTDFLLESWCRENNLMDLFTRNLSTLQRDRSGSRQTNFSAPINSSSFSTPPQDASSAPSVRPPVSHRPQALSSAQQASAMAQAPPSILKKTKDFAHPAMEFLGLSSSRDTERRQSLVEMPPRHSGERDRAAVATPVSVRPDSRFSSAKFIPANASNAYVPAKIKSAAQPSAGRSQSSASNTQRPQSASTINAPEQTFLDHLRRLDHEMHEFIRKNGLSVETFKKNMQETYRIQEELVQKEIRLLEISKMRLIDEEDRKLMELGIGEGFAFTGPEQEGQGAILKLYDAQKELCELIHLKNQERAANEESMRSLITVEQKWMIWTNKTRLLQQLETMNLKKLMFIRDCIFYEKATDMFRIARRALLQRRETQSLGDNQEKSSRSHSLSYSHKTYQNL